MSVPPINVITDLDALAEMVEHYAGQEAWVYDVETMPPYASAPSDWRGNAKRNVVKVIGFASEGRVDVLPLGFPNGEFTHREYDILPSGRVSKDIRKSRPIFTPPPAHLHWTADVKALLHRLFFSDALKIGQNLKFDLTSIAKHFKGFIPWGPYNDTQIMSFLIDNRVKGDNDLAAIVLRETGVELVKGVGKKIEDHGFDEVMQYTGLDAHHTWEAWKILRDKIAALKMRGLLRLEMDVLEALCDMYNFGAPIDVEALKVLDKRLQEELEVLETDVYRAAGRAFNINSTPEKVVLLYGPKSEGNQGLRPRKLTKPSKTNPHGNPSTDDQALSYYAGKNKLVDALLAFAELNKLRSTYTLPYLGGEVTRTTGGKSKTVEKESLMVEGRMHTDFVQTGADTGRFSSKNPNLQNVPNPRTELGKLVRALFHAGPGGKLVVADYSQIEPRILTDLSDDPKMLATYLNNEDIYTTLANPLGLDRAAGKILVLATSYGLGDAAMAESLAVSRAKVQEIRRDFARKFPALEKYKREVIRESKSRKPAYATTILGRRRYLPELFSREDWEKSRAERQAFNNKIQGSAADLMKIAIVRAHQMVPDGAHLILTVHDELVVWCPEHLAEETAEAVREAMEGVKVLKKVPLVADVKIVDNWSQAK